jgi:hypothetical protein
MEKENIFLLWDHAFVTKSLVGCKCKESRITAINYKEVGQHS